MASWNNDSDEASQFESIAQKTCDVCGRTELISQPGPDAFVKWKIVEGTLCPRCVRGGIRMSPSDR
jgi:hypothetical protein